MVKRSLKPIIIREHKMITRSIAKKLSPISKRTLIVEPLEIKPVKRKKLIKNPVEIQRQRPSPRPVEIQRPSPRPVEIQRPSPRPRPVEIKQIVKQIEIPLRKQVKRKRSKSKSDSNRKRQKITSQDINMSAIINRLNELNKKRLEIDAEFIDSLKNLTINPSKKHKFIEQIKENNNDIDNLVSLLNKIDLIDIVKKVKQNKDIIDLDFLNKFNKLNINKSDDKLVSLFKKFKIN